MRVIRTCVKTKSNNVQHFSRFIGDYVSRQSGSDSQTWSCGRTVEFKVATNVDEI